MRIFPKQCTLEKVSLIIPTFNEERNIADKVKNCIELNYPKKLLEVIFIDGGSTDKTIEIINKFRTNNIKIIKMKVRQGKINDMNYALKEATGKIIVISDADSIINRNAISFIVQYLSNSKVGAVGAYTLPYNALPWELEYWLISNKMKILESFTDSTSCLIASCYGFKKNLIEEFPKDVIADDMYVTLKVIEQGYRALYISSAKAIELRSPESINKWIMHKFRKSVACIREIIRFKFRLIKKSRFYPITFFHFLIGPFIDLSFSALLIYILLTKTRLAILIILIVGIVVKINGSLIKKGVDINVPSKNNKVLGTFYRVLNVFLIDFILIAALVSYHFIEKSSKYKRI